MSILAMASACSHDKHAKQYQCTNFSTECELQKDNFLFHPIQVDTSIIDAAGLTVETYGYQWYLFSRKSNCAVAIGIKIGATYVPSPQMIAHYLSQGNENSALQVDTVDISATVPGVTKAMLVLTGKNEIIPKREDGNYIATFAEAKEE